MANYLKGLKGHGAHFKPVLSVLDKGGSINCRYCVCALGNRFSRDIRYIRTQKAMTTTVSIILYCHGHRFLIAISIFDPCGC